MFAAMLRVEIGFALTVVGGFPGVCPFIPILRWSCRCRFRSRAVSVLSITELLTRFDSGRD